MMRLPPALTLVEPAAGFAASFWEADVVLAVVTAVVTCVVLAALGRAAAVASGARARAVVAQTAAFVLLVIRMGGTSGAVKEAAERNARLTQCDEHSTHLV
jgi:hypothetical protein